MQNIIPQSQEEANNNKPVIMCAVCGRPVPAKKGTGRGRTKEVHSKCSILRSRMAEMERMLGEMQFEDAFDVKKMRGDIFAMMNKTLRADVVRITPGDDSEV